MSEKLKQCPFCGGTKICTEKSINLNYCDNCSAESNVEHWNTRPIEDALQARAEKAEAMVERLIELGDDALESQLKITDELLKEATETIGAVVACCTYNSNDDAKIGIYGIDQKAFTRIDQFITHYNDAVSAGKVSVDVKTSTDNNKRSKWKAYVPGWGAPTVNKRYLVKLINDWITIATYYLRVGGGYWKDDRGQELADGVVSLWKGLEE